MNNFNYQKICSSLLSDLGEREKEIVSRRSGLNENQRETLESIGDDFGVCRERIRQIQEASLEKIKPRIKEHQELFHFFLKHLKKFGGVRKENILLEELGGKEQKNEVCFLLTLKEPFQRFSKNADFYSLWTINQDSYFLAKKVIDSISNQLEKKRKPFPLKDLMPGLSLEREVLTSYLQVSKRIHRNQEGFYGFSDWPEINPRGVKDKAYLALRKSGKPLHFSKVADLVEGSHIQTVHNELIKDNRFVLVGRGIYALSEWGYHPGQVRDVILSVLQKADKPLAKEEILDEVLKQRMVRRNTILLNLSDKKYFLKDTGGRYKIKEI